MIDEDIRTELNKLKEMAARFTGAIDEILARDKIEFDPICNLYGHTEGMASEQRSLERAVRFRARDEMRERERLSK